MSNHSKIIPLRGIQEWKVNSFASFGSEPSYFIRKYINDYPTAHTMPVSDGENCRERALQLANEENQKLIASGERVIEYNLNLDNVY